MEIMNKRFPGLTAAFKRLRESKKLIELRDSHKKASAQNTEQDLDPEELPDPAAPEQGTSAQPEPEGASGRQDDLHQITALKNFVDTFITCSLHTGTVGAVVAKYACEVQTHGHTSTCKKYQTKCR